MIVRSTLPQVLMYVIGATKEHGDQCERLIRGQLPSSTKLVVVPTIDLNSLEGLCESITSSSAVTSPSGMLIVVHAAGEEHNVQPPIMEYEGDSKGGNVRPIICCVCITSDPPYCEHWTQLYVVC